MKATLFVIINYCNVAYKLTILTVGWFIVLDNLVLSTDVSSASPSSERIKELWVVCGLYTEEGATLLAGAW